MIESKKIKYLLYNLSDLDKEIKSLESDIMSMDNVGYNAWLRSKHCFVGTVENQAIVLAESKQLNKLRNLKKGMMDSLDYIKSYYPFIYEYIKLKYFEKYTSYKIKEKLNIDYEEQKTYNLRAISLISHYLENK